MILHGNDHALSSFSPQMKPWQLQCNHVSHVRADLPTNSLAQAHSFWVRSPLMNHFLCYLAGEGSKTNVTDPRDGLQVLNNLCTPAAMIPAGGFTQNTHMSWVVSFLWPVIHTAKAGPSDLVALMHLQQQLKEFKRVDVDTLQTLESIKHWNQQRMRQNKKNEHPVTSCSLPLCRCERLSGSPQHGGPSN